MITDRGRSDKPSKLEDHRMELYISDIVTLLDNLGTKKSAFREYSDGCPVGFTFAQRFPGRINAIVSSGNYGQWESAQDTLSLAKTFRTKGTDALIEELEKQEEFRTPEPLRSNLLQTPDPEIFALNEEASCKWCNYDLVPASSRTKLARTISKLESDAKSSQFLSTNPCDFGH